MNTIPELFNTSQIYFISRYPNKVRAWFPLDCQTECISFTVHFSSKKIVIPPYAWCGRSEWDLLILLSIYHKIYVCSALEPTERHTVPAEPVGPLESANATNHLAVRDIENVVWSKLQVFFQGWESQNIFYSDSIIFAIPFSISSFWENVKFYGGVLLSKIFVQLVLDWNDWKQAALRIIIQLTSDSWIWETMKII